MSRGPLIALCVCVSALFAACGDDDPAAPGEPSDRVLGSGAWGADLCTLWEFDEVNMDATFIDVSPPLRMVSHTVEHGDENDPSRRTVLVMDVGHPRFAEVVDHLTNGNPDRVRVMWEFDGGSGWTDLTEKVFFDRLAGEDFAGRRITGLRLVVEKAVIEARGGGGTCIDVQVSLEVLGR